MWTRGTFTNISSTIRVRHFTLLFSREESNVGSSRKMRTVKSKWKGFYPIVSIQLCLTVVHLPMDTNAPAFARNCYATTSMYAASPVVNPVGCVTFLLNAYFLADTQRKRRALKIPLQSNACFRKKSSYPTVVTKLKSLVAKIPMRLIAHVRVTSV